MDAFHECAELCDRFFMSVVLCGSDQTNAEYIGSYVCESFIVLVLRLLLHLIVPKGNT